MGGEFHEVPTRNLAGIVQMFVDNGSWRFPTPKPGEAGCRVPLEFLPPQLQLGHRNHEDNVEKPIKPSRSLQRALLRSQLELPPFIRDMTNAKRI
jgi:hypothetical protein